MYRQIDNEVGLDRKEGILEMMCLCACMGVDTYVGIAVYMAVDYISLHIRQYYVEAVDSVVRCDRF